VSGDDDALSEPPEDLWDDDRPFLDYREYGSEEVLGCVERLLSDAIALRPGAGWLGALARASVLAEQRDRRLPRRPPTELASLFASWLVERADCESVRECLHRALAAARGAETEPMSADLREFLGGYLDGSITDEQFVTRLKKPRGRRPPRGASPAPVAPRGAIPLLEIDDRLREALPSSGATAKDLLAAFAAFARVPVDAAPLHVDDDVLLFESSGTSATLVRQFSLVDADHDYDRMEQLKCPLVFAGERAGDAVDHAIVWSGGDIAKWVAEVEATSAFVALTRLGPPVAVSVDREAI